MKQFGQYRDGLNTHYDCIEYNPKLRRCQEVDYVLCCKSLDERLEGLRDYGDLIRGKAVDCYAAMKDLYYRTKDRRDLLREEYKEPRDWDSEGTTSKHRIIKNVPRPAEQPAGILNLPPIKQKVNPF